MQQARQTLSFLEGIFTDIPIFANLVDNRVADTISLKNRVSIQVRHANFRTIRGITSIACIAEECSMWQSDELGSKNPDKEILAALRPSLATTGGSLFAIGSPHAKRGETWKTFQKHFGANGNPAILVANGATNVFNPTIKQSVIDRAYEDDPAVAASEWGGEFRNDLDNYASYELVESCVERDVHQREYQRGIVYHCHVDASGGVSDSFTCAIGHLSRPEPGGAPVGILDVLLEKRAPFSPEGTVAEFCSIIKEYKIHKVIGDAYSGEFVRELFRKSGVTYELAENSTSDTYAAFLHILKSGRCQLVDNKRMVAQFAGLERRASRIGAKDSIGHPPGGHDDLSCSVSGLMTKLLGKKTPPYISNTLIQRMSQPLPQSGFYSGREVVAVGNDPGLQPWIQHAGMKRFPQ